VLSTIDDGETLNTLSRPAEWDFNAEGTVVELATPADGATSYVIRRVTPLASAYVTFSSGRLSPEQLNQAALFNLYVLQEYLDESGAGTAIDLVALTGRVTANEVDIAANDVDIAANDVDIAALQSGFADYVLQGNAAFVAIEAAFAAIEADNWVTNARMANNSVNTAELVDDSVTSAKLATNSVTSDAIADNAVDTAAIQDDSVGPAQLAPGAVNDAAIGSNVLSPIVSSLNGGQLAGLRNLLINASQNINQRGYVSGAATSSANQYTIDRWRVVTSGQSLSWTTSIGITTYTISTGGIEQVIEYIPVSGSYTLSWVGTATGRVNGVVVPNGNNISLIGGTSATIRFSGGTFSRPQFELGTQATAFEFRPTALELALCQRYYVDDIYVSGGTYASVAGQSCHLSFQLPAEMRATPTATLSNTATVNCSVTGTGSVGVLGGRVLVTASGAGGVIFNTNVACDAEL